MKKRFFIIFGIMIVIAFLFVSCGNEEKEYTAEEIYELVSPSVVTITAESPQVISSGTGFFYNNGSTIITNYHVIENCSTAYITLSNGQKYDVLRVLGYSKDKDIAILDVDYKNGKPLEFRTTEIKTGEKVYAIGNSLGELEGSFSEGMVSSAKREIEGLPYIQTTVSITNGNSGGPLIDKNGKIIGIVSAGVGDGSLELNFAIPISQIDTIDTSTPCLLNEIINVEWISNRQIWHQDENDRYVLVFTLSDANENPVAVSGRAIVTITNNYNEVVYREIRKFNENDFQYWYYDNYTVEKYQATIYINDSDIEPNYCDSGKISFTVVGNDYSFDKYSLDVDGLPQKSIYDAATDEKTVYTAQEFVDSINHNRKIILGSDYYDFSNVDISKNALLQPSNYAEKGFFIDSVYNLSIQGKATFVIDDIYADVLNFYMCSKLSLDGLTVGHINPPSTYKCEGSVIVLNKCNDIKINDCKLFGCGDIGIYSEGSTDIIVSSSEIYDCTYTGVALLWSNAIFYDCKFYDLPFSDSVIYSISSTVAFSDCDITNTNVTIDSFDKCFINVSDYGDVSNITFVNCQISNNTFENITTEDAQNIIFENCNFENNDGNLTHDAVTYKNCEGVQ